MCDSSFSEEDEEVARPPRRKQVRKGGKGSMASSRTRAKVTEGLGQHAARSQASVRSKRRARLTSEVRKSRHDRGSTRPPKSHRAKRRAPQQRRRAAHDSDSDFEEEPPADSLVLALLAQSLILFMHLYYDAYSLLNCHCVITSDDYDATFRRTLFGQKLTMKCPYSDILWIPSGSDMAYATLANSNAFQGL
ncbi:hypothetical protein FGB62_137g10 [Gracilaria domingensis]|nr:hypothetical protein FGB62_137g10 [Gracilaria domingensis]